MFLPNFGVNAPQGNSYGYGQNVGPSPAIFGGLSAGITGGYYSNGPSLNNQTPFGYSTVPAGQLGTYLDTDRGYAQYLQSTFNPSPFCNFPVFGCAPQYPGMQCGGRQAVLQPCFGNLSSYQNIGQQAFGGCQPYNPPQFPGCPPFGFAPPQQSYGGGQQLGSYHCGTCQPHPQPPVHVHHHHHHHHHVHQQPPTCPPEPPVCQEPPAPPVCPPPAPPVCVEPPAPPVCPPPAPPVCVEPPAPPVCPPPAPPVCVEPPAPPCPPPAPPVCVEPPVVEVPKVETPKDPKKPQTFMPVDENWHEGGRGWGRPSEAVSQRLVGGNPNSNARIHFNGQNPDAPGPDRAERMTVWRTLQADPRLQYDVDNKRFLITSETGTQVPVLSLDSRVLADLPYTSGNDLQPTWNSIRASCDQAASVLAGVPAVQAQVQGLPGQEVRPFFPSAERRFG